MKGWKDGEMDGLREGWMCYKIYSGFTRSSGVSASFANHCLYTCGYSDLESVLSLSLSTLRVFRLSTHYDTHFVYHRPHQQIHGDSVSSIVLISIQFNTIHGNVRVIFHK